MISLEAFYPRILPRVPAAPVPMVDEAIRQAAIEFCQRTRLWRGDDEFNVAGECEVVVTPHGAELFEIESARFNGNPLTPVSLRWLDDEVHRWRELSADLGKWITQVEPDTVRVVPMAPGHLALSLLMVPAQRAERLPDWLYQHHARAITDGALAELLSTPGEYANPGLAAFHSDRFQRLLDEVFASGTQGQQKAKIRTKPHFF